MIIQYKESIAKLEDISKSFSKRMSYLEGYAEATRPEDDENGDKVKLTIASGVIADKTQLEAALKKLLSDLESIQK